MRWVWSGREEFAGGLPRFEATSDFVQKTKDAILSILEDYIPNPDAVPVVP